MDGKQVVRGAARLPKGAQSCKSCDDQIRRKLQLTPHANASKRRTSPSCRSQTACPGDEVYTLLCGSTTQP
jgi:hypothetical protein